MFDRTQHVWNATVQANDGQVGERKVCSYWDPDKVSLAEIALVGACEAQAEVKGALRFAPISAELVS